MKKVAVYPLGIKSVAINNILQNVVVSIFKKKNSSVAKFPRKVHSKIPPKSNLGEFPFEDGVVLMIFQG